MQVAEIWYDETFAQIEYIENCICVDNMWNTLHKIEDCRLFFLELYKNIYKIWKYLGRLYTINMQLKSINKQLYLCIN